MVSINDVSKKAGVAKSTVSKVLNNYPYVGDETRKKVEKAVKELRYVPNSVAVSLSKKNFNKAALIIGGQNQFQYAAEICMQYLSSAFKQTKKYSMDVITLFSEQFSKMIKEDIINFLRSEHINCIILYGYSQVNKYIFEALDSDGFYIVVVDADFHSDRVSSISINYKKAQYEVAKKTIEENEISNIILYLAGKEDDNPIMLAKLEAMEELRMELGFQLITKYTNYSEKKARELVLQYGEDVHIIICANDIMAIGSVFALTEMDIFRPVCGFDGILLTGYTQVAVNTVKQAYSEISMQAFHELNRLLKGKSGRHKEIPYEVTTIRYMDIIE